MQRHWCSTACITGDHSTYMTELLGEMLSIYTLHPSHESSGEARDEAEGIKGGKPQVKTLLNCE